MRDAYTDTTAEMRGISEGWDVYGDDDEHLGTVQGLGDGYLLIQKGLIFTKDIYVPMSAVKDAADGVVRVNVGKDELETMGWDEPPMAAGYGDTDAGAMSSPDDHGSRDDHGMHDASGTQRERMALHEEELEVSTAARQTGEVEIRKEIVEERRTIEVPVQREEVHVRRVPADRAAAVDDATFTEQGETLRVPVMEEEIQVTKRPRVREEVEIEKVTRQDTEQVSDTVRREELDVSGTGVAGSRTSYGASSTDGGSLDDAEDLGGGQDRSRR